MLKESHARYNYYSLSHLKKNTGCCNSTYHYILSGYMHMYFFFLSVKYLKISFLYYKKGKLADNIRKHFFILPDYLKKLTFRPKKKRANNRKKRLLLEFWALRY